jgi:hypothetical protein
VLEKEEAINLVLLMARRGKNVKCGYINNNMKISMNNLRIKLTF